MSANPVHAAKNQVKDLNRRFVVKFCFVIKRYYAQRLFLCGFIKCFNKTITEEEGHYSICGGDSSSAV